MTDPANYSTTELAVALKAALRAMDALGGTGLDMVTHWQEEIEGRAERIVVELHGRIGESEAEEQERTRALSAYAARLMALPDDGVRDATYVSIAPD